MADRGVDLSALPKEVRDQLAELDLELSEGERRSRSTYFNLHDCEDTKAAIEDIKDPALSWTGI